MKPFSEGSSSKVFSLPGPVHKQVVLGGKQEWIFRPASKLVTTELLCSEVTFQDGGIRNDQGSPTGGGLDVHLGLKDAYLSVAIIQDHRKY